MTEKQLGSDRSSDVAEVCGEMDEEVVDRDDPEELAVTDDGEATDRVGAEQRIGIVEICRCVDGDDGHAHDRVDACVGWGAGGERSSHDIPVGDDPDQLAAINDAEGAHAGALHFFGCLGDRGIRGNKQRWAMRCVNDLLLGTGLSSQPLAVAVTAFDRASETIFVVARRPDQRRKT